MRNTIIILLLLATTLCYGQAKYTIRKTYQYEGDDSTKAVLVLTEKFNEKAKVVVSIKRNEVEKNGKLKYEDFSKEYYTYRDTFLTEELYVTKNETKKRKNLFTYDPYIGGDSIKTVYEYKLDNENRILQRTTINFYKKREDIEGKWHKGGEWLDEYSYDERYGIVKESFSRKNLETSEYTLFRWSAFLYDQLYENPKTITYRLAAKEFYTQIAEHKLTQVYKYSQDTVKIFDLPSPYLIHSFIEGDTAITLRIPGYETFIYNTKKELTTKIHRQQGGYSDNGYDSTFVYYTYDEYGRIIKETNLYYRKKRTKIYTYE